MPKPKNLSHKNKKNLSKNDRGNNNNKKNKNNDSGVNDSLIKEEESLLSEFVERKMPTDTEMEKFDEYVDEEVKDHKIEDGLSEIYQDEEGKIVDVKKLEVKKERSIVFKIFFVLLLVSFMAVAGWFAYNFISSGSGSDSRVIKFEIESPENIMAGEEFFYTVKYKNMYNVDLENVEINIKYPDSFIFLDSSPQADKDNIYSIGKLVISESGEIKIKGKIIAEEDETAILLADVSYSPANFSSEFKKEIVNEMTIKGIGIDFDFVEISSVLVGEENNISVKYEAGENNFINNFRLSVKELDNMEIISDNSQENELVEVLDVGVWQINNIDTAENELDIRFKINEKLNDKENIILSFEYSEDGEEYYKFLEKNIELEIIKSDLNLILIINGSRESGAINFGDTLNYSLSYENKGESRMKDVVIMAVLDSGLFDWDSLSDGSNGQLNGDTISWSKQEITGLESLESGEEGVIDFSIDILDLEDIDLANFGFGAQKLQTKSYAQFSIGSKESVEDNEDTKSNTIINKINSNLELDEQVRYFNDDNIAVGSGPLPPQVGEMTSYKVYWTLTNNLHELNNVVIETELPFYVAWSQKDNVSVGSMSYDSSSRKVSWNVGRFPESVYKVEAEFAISIIPVEADINTIKVLLSNTHVSALDSETNDNIDIVDIAKTTKLETDVIAATDGRIER